MGQNKKEMGSILAVMMMLFSIKLISAFVTPQASPRPSSVLCSSAGQGGGIFYDGPEYKKDTSSSSASMGSFSPQQQPSSPLASTHNQRRVLHKDIVVVGGGLAGLSAALYLQQMAPERRVTILDKEATQPTTVASMAAAGMLAPQSERLPSGPLLDLCLESRRLYPDFCDFVETLAQEEDVAEYLYHADDTNDLPPWSVGYVASGGFLAPAFAGDAVATWAPPPNDSSQSKPMWLDATQVRELEPHLHPDVVGGWWFPEDASVDARRLTCSLRAACVAAGVELLSAEVTSLDLVDGHCRGVWCNSSGKSQKYLKTKQVLVANGAWMRQLLPVPLEPHKGQSLSLRMPPDRPPLLRRVLFAQDSYIVPKADGRIVVGATVEAGSYDPNVTPAGVLHILTHALQLVPGLADLALEETWVGLRPTTPDKGPILGSTPWDNLFLAGGYWRNGVLLAPKTGQLIATLMTHPESLSESDRTLLEAFAWDRFTSPEGGAQMAANARYAASMHPVHRRTSGVGVAASVGTELGSYSTARSASDERQKDRQALFEAGDVSLERAALLGKQDANAYVSEDDPKEGSRAEATQTSEAPVTQPPPMPSLPSSAATVPYEGSADALTVGSSPAEEDHPAAGGDLQSIYDTIQENQRAREVEMTELPPAEREDPGFRIYHVDSDTGTSREVPPYTSPEEMEQIVAQAKQSGVESTLVVPTPQEDGEEEGDSIFDGYQAIEEENAGLSEEEMVQSMREVRMQNRAESSAATESLDISENVPSSFGSLASRMGSSSTKSVKVNGDVASNSVEKTPMPLDTLAKEMQIRENQEATQQEPLSLHESEDEKLNDLYEFIRTNKAEVEKVEMGEAAPDDRPDPGFRLYHVDPETGESREVPPYTSPEEMEQIVAREKAGTSTNATDLPPVDSDSATKPATETVSSSTPQDASEEDYNEQTYDGYTEIEQANSRGTREEELEAMRVARRQNRFLEDVDTNQIGVRPLNGE